MNRDLFQFISDVVGSENVVKVRRLFFPVLDGCFNDLCLPITQISSGSKAEGLDLPGSDFDVMHVLNYINLCDGNSGISSTMEHDLVVDAEHAAPGFVLLKSPFGTNYFDSVELTTDGALLCNDEFKLYWKRKQNHFHLLYEKHGPCISAATDKLDLAHCLKGNFWPSVASQWIQRPRLGNWPSPLLISEIVHNGILFVPIGSKFGSTTDNRFEWRMSFSVAEKILIHSFNHTQLLCYALLKIVLKEVINKTSHLKDLLCSYYMKTVMFWVIEEQENTVWIPDNIVECFKACLKRVLYFVRYGYCPNYFIPQNNMFEGKFLKNQNALHLITLLEELFLEGLTLFTNSDTLIGFLKNSTPVDLNGKFNIPQEDVAMYAPLSSIHALPHFNDLCSKYVKKVISKTRKHKKSMFAELQKDLKVLVTSNIIAYFCRHSQNRLDISNKPFSVKYKEFLCYLLIGTIFDISGWLWLGVFFYKHNQFIKTLVITENVMKECSHNKILISIFSNAYLRSLTKINIDRKLSFLQKHRLQCLHEMNELWQEETLLHGTDLSSYDKYVMINHPVEKSKVSVSLTTDFLDSMSENISCTPVEFVHFLRFMCYHHLNIIDLRDDCLVDLAMAVQLLPYTWSSHLTSPPCAYLLRAGDVTKNPNIKYLAGIIMLRNQKAVGKPKRGDVLCSFPSFFRPDYE